MNTHFPPLICTQIFADDADSSLNLNLRSLSHLRTIFCCIFIFLLFGFQPVSAQTSTPQVSVSQVRVTITVLDANSQPVTGIRLELVIFQYAMSVEPTPAGGCETDVNGSCEIVTNTPPSSGADWYEGLVYVSDLGRQWVGWQGNETLIVIQLTSDGMIATEEPPLHGPYTGEQYAPTEGSPVVSPTVTRTATSTATQAPTEITIPTLTLTPTLTPIPSPNVIETSYPLGGVIIGVLLVGGGLWWVFTRRIKRHG